MFTETGSGPTARALEGLKSNLGDRIDTTVDAWKDKGIGIPEKLGHTAAQATGGLFDLAAAPLGYAADLMVPGNPLEQGFEKAVETDLAQDMMLKYEKLSSEDKRRISSGIVPVEAALALMGLKDTARNARTFVKNFYGSPHLKIARGDSATRRLLKYAEGAVGKASGAAQSFTQGAVSAVKQAVTPRGQAMLRAGVPAGVIDEINDSSRALQLIDKIDKKRAAGTELTGDEKAAWDSVSKHYGSKDADGNHVPPKPGVIRSYIEGSLAARMNMMMQEGRDGDVIKAFVQEPLAQSVNRLSDNIELKKQWQLPSVVHDRFHNHITAHLGRTIPGEDPIVVTRAATNALINEGAGQRGTPYFRLFNAFNEKGGRMYEKGDTPMFASPAQAKDFIEASNLSPEDQANWAKIRETYSPKTATKREKNKFERLEKLVNDNKFTVKASEDGEWLFFQSAHNSSVKDLGATNAFTAFNPRTGQTHVILNDKHDLFGYEAPGQEKLMVVIQPISWNAYETTKKGKVKARGTGAQSTRQEAIDKTAEITGVSPDGVKRLAAEGGKKATAYDEYAAQLAEQWSPTPTARDYVSAAGGAAKVGAGGGMLTSRFLGNEEDE